jgi:hypothetical protein
MNLAFPRISVRVVAVLMLIAGASLGVLLAKTMWAEPPRPVKGVFDEALEYKVGRYVDYYRLDAQGADRVRRRLQAHDDAVTGLYRTLRQQNAMDFDFLRAETEADLKAILMEEVEKRKKADPPTPR